MPLTTRPDTEASFPDASRASSPRGGNRNALPDPLYGASRLSAWAAAIVATPPFQRLARVSLSDVPGELLSRG